MMRADWKQSQFYIILQACLTTLLSVTLSKYFDFFSLMT